MDRVRNMKTRAASWLQMRGLFGSTDNINCKSPEAISSSNKSEFEATSVKVQHLLHKKQYQKVIEILRELSYDYLQKCLESFPFKILNRNIPDTFPIWETVLTKLHTSEDGFIPSFPYAACDELVLEIAKLLVANAESHDTDLDLMQSCKRVMKRVYMQYRDVLQQLYKEQSRVEKAFYSLSLHLPLGIDRHATPLHQAITQEVKSCLEDYSDAIDHMEHLTNTEVVPVSETLQGGAGREMSVDTAQELPIAFPLAPDLNQVQIQERLYFNQCILTNLQPGRRKNNLPELLEILNERIQGDKEVLAIFGNIRLRNEAVSDVEPVGPWLSGHQKAIECAISSLKSIEKELCIKTQQSDSPVTEPHYSTSTEEETAGPIYMAASKHNSANLEECVFSKQESTTFLENDEEGFIESLELRRKLSLPVASLHRSRSISPHKILRIAPRNVYGSSHSVDSSEDSNSNLHNGASASVHDLLSTSKDAHTAPAFTRASSQRSRPVVAGVKQKSRFSFHLLPSSLTNLASGSSKAKKNKMYRSGSGNIVASKEDRIHYEGGDGNPTLLLQELECKNIELMEAKETIQNLVMRERELTDRLSEQAQRQLQDSEKFEDILMGASRPTMVVQRYEELYSQGRVEAMEAVEGLLGSQEAGSQLLLDVLLFAYAASQSSLERLHSSWKALLYTGQQGKGQGRGEGEGQRGAGEGPGGDEGGGSNNVVATKQLCSAVGLYLRRVCEQHDVTSVIEEVMSELGKKHMSLTTDNNLPPEVFPQLVGLRSFMAYVEECAHITWELCVQTPPMVVSCEDQEFSVERHHRFYNADKTSTAILSHLWPVLLQTPTGPILVRGTVMT